MISLSKKNNIIHMSIMEKQKAAKLKIEEKYKKTYIDGDLNFFVGRNKKNQSGSNHKKIALIKEKLNKSGNQNNSSFSNNSGLFGNQNQTMLSLNISSNYYEMPNKSSEMLS